MARNVTSKCFYNTLPRLSQRAPSTNGPQRSVVDQEEGDLSTLQAEPLPTPQDSGDLGYSSILGSNTFMGLNQVLENDNEFRAIAATHNQSSRSLRREMRAREITAQLPPMAVITSLVNIFFSDVNWHYFILERFYFDDLFLQWQNVGTQRNKVKYLKPRDLSWELQYFPALLFQILALALQFLPPESEAQSEWSRQELASSEEYSDRGEELLALLGRQGAALSAVHADLLRSSWLKNFGRGAEAWHSVGNAVRQGQELGLHRQKDIHQAGPDSIEETLSLLWYEEYKKRTWANLFVWDSLMAMILGRPRMINADDCNAKLPTDCSIPKDPSRTVPGTVQQDENTAGPTTVSATLLRYALASKVHEMRALKVDQPHPKDYSVIRTLHEQVISILNNMPPFLRHKNPDTLWDSDHAYLPLQREETLVLANMFLMTLHRPHILTHPESRKTALQAALATLESQQRLFKQTSKHHYPLFSLAFYTVDAAILLCVVMRTCPPESHEIKRYIMQILEQAIERLSQVQAVNPIAKSGLPIIQQCYQKIKEFCDIRSNASVTISASGSSPGSALRDITRDLIHQDETRPEDTPSNRDLLNGGGVFGSPTLEL